MKLLFKFIVFLLLIFLSSRCFCQTPSDAELKRYIQDLSVLLECCSKTPPCENTNANFCADKYEERGAAKFLLKDYTGAIQDCNKAIQLNNKLGSAYLTRGLVYYDMGDVKNACIDFQKAQELGNPSATMAIQKCCK